MAAVEGRQPQAEDLQAGSAQMRYAAQLARLYASVARPVLLLGPVGAGKTTLARIIHRQSGRSGPFVAISAGELTETLYSDTLFGHTVGAFTGAAVAHRGALERAAGGTLLLDDIAFMPRVAQASILRVLESGRFRPLGASDDRTSTGRFLFATTVSPADLVRTGALIPDLESRIGELVIHVPSLSQHREDILPLAQNAGQRFLLEHGYEGDLEFTDECEDLLIRYPWPRNVRELRGVIERAVVHAGLSNGVVVLRAGHLPDRFHQPFEETTPATTLTRALVESVLLEVEGNQSEAARRLGVHRNTIARCLRNAG